MKILENVPLSQYTTFKIGGKARFFCAVRNEKEMVEAVLFARGKDVRFIVLGGGSNVLISDAGYSGLVIKNEITGIEIINKGENEYILSAGAGEVWDEVVKRSVDENLHGIENLSAIPGTTGAAPIQNIGAYGTDIADVVHKVRVLNTQNMTFEELACEDCDFGYRDSIFKKQRGKYIVTRVSMVLIKGDATEISYKDLKLYFENKGYSEKDGRLPSVSEVRDAVLYIRSNKLPDWKKWGTAGSFFKNPIISKIKYDELKQKYPELPGYEEPGDKVKVALGWVLDHVCKVRGVTNGNVGTYEKQALVIVSKPGATAEEVVSFSREIMDKVYNSLGIKIEAEVEWVN